MKEENKDQLVRELETMEMSGLLISQYNEIDAWLTAHGVASSDDLNKLTVIELIEIKSKIQFLMRNR